MSAFIQFVVGFEPHSPQSVHLYFANFERPMTCIDPPPVPMSLPLHGEVADAPRIYFDAKSLENKRLSFSIDGPNSDYFDYFQFNSHPLSGNLS
jgi:hypothetical protein